MSHKFRSSGFGIGLIAVLAVGQASQASLAATKVSAPPTFGEWQERDVKTHFELRPGPTPSQIVLTIPKDVQFPGSHEFLLTRASDGAFQANSQDRPRVSLSFQSPVKANLSVRGSGTTSSGTWVSVNDFILVRP